VQSEFSAARAQIREREFYLNMCVTDGGSGGGKSGNPSPLPPPSLARSLTSPEPSLEILMNFLRATLTPQPAACAYSIMANRFSSNY